MNSKSKLRTGRRARVASTPARSPDAEQEPQRCIHSSEACATSATGCTAVRLHTASGCKSGREQALQTFSRLLIQAVSRVSEASIRPRHRSMALCLVAAASSSMRWSSHSHQRSASKKGTF